MTAYKNLSEMIDECYPRWRNMPPREIFEEVARETIKAVTPERSPGGVGPDNYDIGFHQCLSEIEQNAEEWMGNDND